VRSLAYAVLAMAGLPATATAHHSRLKLFA
jgi:hypothetical protein